MRLRGVCSPCTANVSRPASIVSQQVGIFGLLWVFATFDFCVCGWWWSTMVDSPTERSDAYCCERVLSAHVWALVGPGGCLFIIAVTVSYYESLRPEECDSSYSSLSCCVCCSSTAPGGRHVPIEAPRSRRYWPKMLKVWVMLFNRCTIMAGDRKEANGSEIYIKLSRQMHTAFRNANKTINQREPTHRLGPVSYISGK